MTLQIKKQSLLIFADWFEPGFKAGGPIRSVVNFVDHMKADYEVYVFTSDRDLGETQGYSGIEADQWLNKHGYRIFYASPSYIRYRNIRKIIAEVNADFIYVNSMFSFYFSIVPIFLNRNKEFAHKTVISVRGMLMKSALQVKRGKKELFLRIFKLFNVQRDLIFLASSPEEVAVIGHRFGNSRIIQVDNFPGLQPAYVPPADKIAGQLRMIFVGRIHPIKNLDFLLNCLMDIDSEIHLTIVATLEDFSYWQTCKAIIEKLPSNIGVEFIQDLPNSRISAKLYSSHVFVLPTKGENFGHAIYEAFSHGRPVIISDQTPWRNLAEEKAGFDLPLNDFQKYIDAIRYFCSMDQNELGFWCKNSWRYGREKINVDKIKSSYLDVFSNKER